MSEFLYRFRSINALLDGFNELKNQEIYFAPPDQLNDPVEGYKDIFWTGDEIVWKNLLKHYLLCLESACSLFVLDSEGEGIDENWLPVFKTEIHLPTEKYKEIYKKICADFFIIKEVSKYPELLKLRSNAIRRNELSFYLGQLHDTALNVIFSVYESYNLIRPGSNPFSQIGPKQINLELISKINELELSSEGKDTAENIFEIASNLNSELHLTHAYINSEKLLTPNKKSLFFEFPEKYIKALERLVYPNWYTACFMDNCNNPSVWGHYGESHKGVCLKFKPYFRENIPFIRLKGIVSSGGTKTKSDPIYKDREHKFYKVEYTKTYPEIDFFNSLGRLSPSDLNKWYFDEQGKASICGTDVLRSSDQWREKYWHDFHTAITKKLEDWSYEKEYRLILGGGSINFTNPETRKLKFNFNDLEGLIFGIKTPVKDKLKTMKIIEDKCRKEARSDFKFFQAYYSPKNGKIEAFELTSFKIKNS